MTVAVVLLTYNRLEYAKRTLRALARNLESFEHIFRFHIASDGDSSTYIEELRGVLEAEGHIDSITVSNSDHGGYGRNYNLAMQTVHDVATWIMPIEDDWELLRAFNPDSIIRDMEDLDIGCARLGYMGYTQELRCSLAYGTCGHWLRFDPASAEPHVFAGHPRIESRMWSRMVGPWTEGLLPGETEFEVSHRKPARTGVAWPVDRVKLCGDLFAHIGTVRSY